MSKTKIRIFLSLLLLIGLTSYREQKSNNKLLLNKVLIDNQNNFRDDYDPYSAWVEIFNKSYGSADLAACLLKVSGQPGDTVTCFIPKGDILTLVKLRRYALFWADGEPNRRTFHTSFKLNPEIANWVGLFDSGRRLPDQVVIPTGALGPSRSYAHISDGAAGWEAKGGSKDKYVTPSTNNKTFGSNAKMEKFKEHDSVDISMPISVMNVAFCGLVLLFVALKVVGKVAANLNKHNTTEVKNINKVEAKELSQVPGEVYAAISVTLHEMQDEVHDVEETVLIITRVKRSYSPWSSRIYTLRENPNRR